MTDLTDKSGRQGDEREQGAALVTVLIFMLGIVALVLLIVPPAQKNLESEALDNRRRSLEFLLQQAVHDAIHEAKENVDYDAVANDAGAVGVAPKATWTAGGTFADYGTGTQVTLNGRNQGVYMAVVRTDANGVQILNVVAAYPDFTNPRELVAAQVQLETTLQGLFGDRSAISFAGNLAGTSGTGSGNFGWQNNGDQTVQIDATSTYDPDGPLGPLPAIHAPAVNISDSDFYNGFMTEFVNDPTHGEGGTDDGLDLEGGDIGDYSTTTTVAPDTIAQEPSSTQRVNEDFLEQWIDHWRDAGNQTPDDTINSNTTWTGGGPNQLTFLTASQLKNGNVITGSGTLIIRGNLTMSGGAKLNWDGDVIIIPSGGSGQGKLIVKDAEINVNGGLVLAPDPADNKTVGLYTDHEDAAVNVNGTLLAIQAGTGSAEISIQKGGELKVDGLLGMLGDNIAMEVNGAPGSAPGDPGRSKLHVEGSTVVAVPPGGSGLQKLRFDAASDTIFKFDNPKFEAGVQLAEEGSQHSTVEPPPYQVYRTGYREVSPTTVLGEFEALRLDATDGAGVSAP